MKDTKAVLISWIARRNDPFNRGSDGTPGPTLTLLFDESSPYVDRIADVVLLHREHGEDTRDELTAVEGTIQAIRERNPKIEIHPQAWLGADPTDHKAIYEFLGHKIPELRAQFAGRELIVHISPGTSSMQTIWVLMGETGLIGTPFELVQSYRRSERRDRHAVVPVRVGLDTFYKAYAASHPRHATTTEQELHWDPQLFCGDRMRRLFLEARRFAAVSVPVLLLGERGTGKSTLANWIRANSPYRRPDLSHGWPAIACGQYDPSTMRSELFGHEKGAFTDAKQRREGLLAQTHGDTLFLDEIGDISRDLQRMLIKALEEKKYLPLGADSPRASDFRLLCATNLPDAELRERLDPDFLDRVSMLTLELPPLRKIPEELDWMWPQVFAKAAQRANAEHTRVMLGKSQHARVVERLRMEPLPGNLRDLFRVAYRIIAACGDPGAPLAPDEAVSYGLELLTRDEWRSKLTNARAVARAFAEMKPLDPFVGESLETTPIFKEFKHYIGTELRRIAQRQGTSAESLCDVGERALRNWVRADAPHKRPSSRKKGSKRRKKSSAR